MTNFCETQLLVSHLSLDEPILSLVQASYCYLRYFSSTSIKLKAVVQTIHPFEYVN